MYVSQLWGKNRSYEAICLVGKVACILLVGQWKGVVQEFRTLESRVLPD